jgi:hypothetical protein
VKYRLLPRRSWRPRRGPPRFPPAGTRHGHHKRSSSGTTGPGQAQRNPHCDRRVGPTTPTRAGRLYDASVDPTDARKATVRRFGRSDRRAQGDRSTLRLITTTRAARLLDASVDPTDARKVTVRYFGRSDRRALCQSEEEPFARTRRPQGSASPPPARIAHPPGGTPMDSRSLAARAGSPSTRCQFLRRTTVPPPGGVPSPRSERGCAQSRSIKRAILGISGSGGALAPPEPMPHHARALRWCKEPRPDRLERDHILTTVGSANGVHSYNISEN